jgi:hypothetical protein
MRNVVATMLALAVVAFFAVRSFFPGYEDVAQKRVENVLNGMRQGTEASNPKVETAMAMWAQNAFRITDRDRLSWASDNFDKWRNKKKMYRKIGEFTIDKVELVPNSPEETAIVTFTLEGKEYKVNVPKDHAISWVN